MNIQTAIEAAHPRVGQSSTDVGIKRILSKQENLLHEDITYEHFQLVQKQ